MIVQITIIVMDGKRGFAALYVGGNVRILIVKIVIHGIFEVLYVFQKEEAKRNICSGWRHQVLVDERKLHCLLHGCKVEHPPEYTLRLGNERIELCERCAKLLRDKLICEFGSE